MIAFFLCGTALSSGGWVISAWRIGFVKVACPGALGYVMVETHFAQLSLDLLKEPEVLPVKSPLQFRKTTVTYLPLQWVWGDKFQTVLSSFHLLRTSLVSLKKHLRFILPSWLGISLIHHTFPGLICQ